MGDPDFVVVDGVPVMLPSYDEAVSSGLNALAPGYSAASDQGHNLQTEDQNPPAYPGLRIPDTLPSEFETCGSRSGSSELLQSLYPSLTCQGAALPGSDRTDVSQSADGDAASTSPRIDITDGESCIGAIGESMNREHHLLVLAEQEFTQPTCLYFLHGFVHTLIWNFFKIRQFHGYRVLCLRYVLASCGACDSNARPEGSCPDPSLISRDVRKHLCTAAKPALILPVLVCSSAPQLLRSQLPHIPWLSEPITGFSP